MYISQSKWLNLSMIKAEMSVSMDENTSSASAQLPTNMMVFFNTFDTMYFTTTLTHTLSSSPLELGMTNFETSSIIATALMRKHRSSSLQLIEKEL
jgi:hypothetical protein